MYLRYIGNILYDKELLERDRKFVIFGSGLHGKMVLDYLEKQGVKANVLCFCDSNDSFADTDIQGIPIYKPMETCQRYPYADYLIGGKYSREMYFFLKECSISRIHLLLVEYFY